MGIIGDRAYTLNEPKQVMHNRYDYFEFWLGDTDISSILLVVFLYGAKL